MNSSLLLTLGHNSSAIWTDGTTVIGYEQERLDRIKSQSKFPVDAIREIEKHVSLDTCEVFVSHWFDSFDLRKASSRHPRVKKYWNYDEWPELRGRPVVQLTCDFTHHDAHAWSIFSFIKSHGEPVTSWSFIVCDGFGNRQEVISVYTCSSRGPSLVDRSYGYQNSLGLMYQKATSFCGMKENQDEYKFLGYESRILEYLEGSGLEILCQRADETVEMLEQTMKSTTAGPICDFINLDELNRTEKKWNSIFRSIIDDTCCLVRERKSYTSSMRATIGFFIQKVIESFYGRLIERHHMQNVAVAGGVHLNVKLNNHIFNKIGAYNGKFCAVPLAGDQGAAIGLYEACGRQFPFHSLLWGRRDLSPFTSAEALAMNEVRYCHNREDYVEAVVSAIKQDQLVNTLVGPMEFGPRALCNTSTLANPSQENVDAINALNGRDTVMPFAPVMLRPTARKLFGPKLDRVVASDRYMITAVDYIRPTKRIEGVAHPYPTNPHRKTGRPQVISQHDTRPIAQILEAVGTPLINTSLNVHGVPIVFSLEHAITDLKYNLEQAKKLRLKAPVLIVGVF
jgi:predicted NodU family carbamoyl transferase